MIDINSYRLYKNGCCDDKDCQFRHPSFPVTTEEALKDASKHIMNLYNYKENKKFVLRRSAVKFLYQHPDALESIDLDFFIYDNLNLNNV